MSDGDLDARKSLLLREFTELLILAARRWRRSIGELGFANNISATDVDILLSATNFDNGLQQIAVADYAGIGALSLTRLLDRLSMYGLLYRSGEQGHDVGSFVKLTDAGKIIAARVDARLAEHRTSVLAEISVDQLKTTVHVLRHLAECLPPRGS
jgi:MarR family transcriptional regulator for hemolysin